MCCLDKEQLCVKLRRCVFMLAKLAQPSGRLGVGDSYTLTFDLCVAFEPALLASASGSHSFLSQGAKPRTI